MSSVKGVFHVLLAAQTLRNKLCPFLPLLGRSHVRPFTLFFLGVGSWLLTTAIFAEAPYFVSRLDGDRSLYSVFDLAVQGSNVVPVLIVSIRLLYSKRLGRKAGMTFNVALISILYAIAFASWGLLIYAAQLAHVSHTNARAVKTTLVLASLGAGIVGTTSMISFFNMVPSKHAGGFAALSTGIGVCGLITQCLAVVQGLGRSASMAFRPLLFASFASGSRWFRSPPFSRWQRCTRQQILPQKPSYRHWTM